MIGVGLSIVQLAVRQMLGGAFTPATLFANSESGVWYDPSDLTTLFQDSAGTTPVTAVEQPVGKMFDKSGRGFHATQTTSTSRPVLSARYNLLTKTEQFDDVVWVRAANVAVSSNFDGNADRVTYNGFSSDGASAFVNQLATSPGGTASRSFTVSATIKSAGTGNQTIRLKNTHSAVLDNFSSDITVTPTYQTFTFTVTNGASAGNGLQTAGLVAGTANAAYDIVVASFSLVPANQASLPYQRVNTATDYDTVGFPSGETFDGSDDYQTASSGGGSTSAFFWCSAIMVRKVGSTQTLFSDAGTNTGYRVRINASNQLELSAGNGSAYTTVATTATLAYGQIAVLTAWHDGTNLKVQIDNGTVHQTAFATASAGTASLTIGRDNGAASSYAGIRLFEKVYLKNLVPSAGDIAKTKTYVGATAGMTI